MSAQRYKLFFESQIFHKKSTSVGAEVPNSFNIVDVTCRHKGTNFSLNRNCFLKKHFNYKATPNCWANWAISLRYSLHFWFGSLTV